MSNNNPLFTVFTPTYNRAARLHGVYESLLSQTCPDFEWLVVDDGSTDDTHKLICSWQADPKTWFPIRYLYQKHGHKKVAHNYAVCEAKGTLFLPLDSDDRCVSSALDRFKCWWFSIPKRKRTNFSGVCVLCMDEQGGIIGNQFPCNSYLDSDSLRLRYIHGVVGEKWGFTRTDIVRDFPYPEHLPGNVTAGIVWDRIAREYELRCVNEALRVYVQDGETSDRITKRGLKRDVTPGLVFQKCEVIDSHMRFFTIAPWTISKEAMRYTRFWLHCPGELKAQYLPVHWDWTRRGLVLATAPVGGLLWLRDLSLRKKS